jgi:uracil-DNA glycosylase
MTRLLPCIRSIGPRNAKVAFVGEAPGEQEEKVGVPFIGSSGQEFDRLIEEAGFSRRDVFLTNAFFTRPPDNKLEQFCVSAKELKALGGYGPGWDLGPLGTGKYIHPEFLPELVRLRGELAELKPNLIVALGATALWALTGSTGITRVRGTVQHTEWGKILPTFHPAYILRDWSSRPILLADLLKAERESHFPEIIRPERWVLVEPTIPELCEWVDIGCRSTHLAVDVETKAKQITDFGFSYSPSEAISIPFIDYKKPGNSYWTLEEEVFVRQQINRLLTCPAVKIFQNGLYDLQYILKERYKICNVQEDTMLQHHAMYPELQKSLGFLGSIYTNEASWKLMRKRAKEEVQKADD